MFKTMRVMFAAMANAIEEGERSDVVIADIAATALAAETIGMSEDSYAEARASAIAFLFLLRSFRGRQ